MKQKRSKFRKGGVAILAGIILLALASVALAQVSSNYDLSWHVIGGGIAQMESTDHSLQGTFGQTAIEPMTSAERTLCNGFWCEESGKSEVYLPLVLRNSP
jgi:hypothetical protein